MKRLNTHYIISALILMFIFSSCGRVDKQFYENGNLESELPYKNGKLNGTAIWYYEDGTIKMEVPYVDNSIEGLSIRYHDNGRKEAEEFYQNNLLNGKAIEYNITGKRSEQKNYVNDTLHGEYHRWYGNGELQILGGFVNGLYEGTWLYYDDYGSLIGEGKYLKGKGIQRFWSYDGSLRSRTPYVNNLKNGEEKFYTPSGDLDYVVVYEDGEIVSQ